MPLALLALWNNKAIRYTFLGVLVLLVIYLLGRKAGKKKALESVTDIPLPNGGTDIPATWDPKPLANDLYTVMDGWFTLAITKEKVFVRMLDLTAGQLVALYNAFNNLFSAKGKGTLTQWLRDELNVTTTSVRDSIVQRLVSLNCR